MKSVGLLKINESSIWHVTYSKFGFFGKKVTIFRKNLKIDNHSSCIKIKTRQNKELKNRRKNIVWSISLKITWNRAARSLYVCQIPTNNGRWQQWFDQSRWSSNCHQGYLGYSPVKTKVRLKNLLNDRI